MGKSEPSFAPQWYKSGGVNSSGGTSNSNYQTLSSSNSDDHVIGPSLRNRLSPTASDHDTHRSSFSVDRTSNVSSRRSMSANGSLSNDKNSSTHSRAYSSFSRSYRDRDREKNFDFFEKERSVLVGNGYDDYSNSFLVGRTEKDTLLQSQTKVAGRWPESQPKRPVNDVNNGILSASSLVSCMNKSSFERDFPSLGVEEKQVPPEIGRVSSPGLSTAAQSIPLGSSVIIGGEGWTSALAEVPAVIGVNRPMLPSVPQSAPSISPSISSSTNTCLNMAETLAKAPSHARVAPQLSLETQRLEELAIKQSRQLIPMTPSTPKSSTFNSSEKLKTKGVRSGEISVLPKVAPQSSQHSSQQHRGPVRTDVSKTPQVGNFQILNRERVNPSTANKVPTSTNARRVVNVAPFSVNSMKNPSSPKLKTDGKATDLSVIQNSVIEKRLSLQSQNRHDFFNSLRNKYSNDSAASQESVTSSSTSEKLNGQAATGSASVFLANETSVSNSGMTCSMMNRNGVNGLYNSSKEPEKLSSGEDEKDIPCSDAVVPDEEEERFLRSLGWQENAGEEALTAEEINAFVKEYEMKLKASPTLCQNELQQSKGVLPEGGVASSELRSSDSEGEA